MSSPLAPFYEIREKLISLYGKNTFLIRVIYKFIMTFFMMQCIVAKSGYVSLFDKLPVILIICLLCSFMPVSLISFLMCLILLVEYLKLSLVVCAFTGCMMLIMILIDTIFAPGCGGILFLVPLAFYMKVPFLLPLVLGLVAPMVSIIPLGFGTALYFLMTFVNESAGVLSNSEDSMIDTFRALVLGIQTNAYMYFVILAFIATMVVVSMIHRLQLDHAWTIAISIGAVLDIVLLLIGVATCDGADMTPISVVLFGLLSAIIAYIVSFMVFSVDYKQTIHTQFEDDDYYYYVKAVPKVKVADRISDKKIIIEDEDKEKKEEEAKPLGSAQVITGVRETFIEMPSKEVK